MQARIVARLRLILPVQSSPHETGRRLAQNCGLSERIVVYEQRAEQASRNVHGLGHVGWSLVGKNTAACLHAASERSRLVLNSHRPPQQWPFCTLQLIVPTGNTRTGERFLMLIENLRSTM